jgi:folate-dependent phosphoribosylglycinamide formyltransferase PurN
MKLAILTSHNPRHYYVANQLSSFANEALVVSSAMGLNPAVSYYRAMESESMARYFSERFSSEMYFFQDRTFNSNNQSILVVGESEINSGYVVDQLKKFSPDMAVVFGTNILKPEILRACKKIINIHLGLSPYYNGSSTNFWPMYEMKYEYVGVTVHHVDEGVDTGNILGQTRALIDKNDTPHSIGNKNIILGVNLVKQILPYLQRSNIVGLKQWEVVNKRQYLMKSYTPKIEQEFRARVLNGEISSWVERGEKEFFDLVQFVDGHPSIVSSEFFQPEVVNIT